MIHAEMSPSRLDRVIGCPGSVQAATLCEEETSSKYAQEGTLLHRAVDEARDLGLDAIKYIDEDGKNAVEDCLDYAQEIINSLGHSEFITASETRVSLTGWDLPEIYGMLDYVIHDLKNHHVHILDWKFGRGVLVEAMHNSQMLAYAAGWVSMSKERVDRITLHIVQPRINNFDKWTLHHNDLSVWVTDTLTRAVALAKGKVPPLVPGEKQCRWCPARDRCPALHKQVIQDATLLFDAARNIQLIGNEEIAEVLQLIPRLKDAIKSIQLFAHLELDRGRDVPGYKLVAGRSIRKWDNVEVAIAWLDKNSAVEELFISKPVSPAQAEKGDRSLKKNKDFHSLVVKPKGNPLIVPSSDPRPSVQASSIDVFKNVASLDK